MITAGTVLMERGTPRPKCVQLESDSSPETWIAVKHDPGFPELERALAAAGWTFFHMAGAIEAMAFGVDREKMIQAALKRLITRAKEQRCNSLQIDSVKVGSFLGIRSMRIFAHPRHLQQGLVFAGR